MSKGNPLTQDEVEDLLAVKSQLNAATWEHWLVLAREEKRARFNFAAKSHPNEGSELVPHPVAHKAAMDQAEAAGKVAAKAAVNEDADAANRVMVATDPAQQRELEKQRMRESAVVPVSVMKDMKQRCKTDCAISHVKPKMLPTN